MAVSSLTAQREQHVSALEHNLISIVQQLGAIPAVWQVILFGSYARGRRDLLTDLDLLVVMDSPLDFVTRCAEMARQIKAGVALDLLVYTPAELEQMRHRPFMQRILNTGKVIYARES